MTDAIKPVAWIEHHKAGDNLVWDDPGGKRTPLYTADALAATREEGRLEMRAELAAAQKDAERLRAELAAMRKAASALTEIVRMPNAEHIADAHNAAVRLLKETHDE